MKPIIARIDRELIKKELSSDKFLRPTNKAHNEIYIITSHDSPNVMLEIGRLRELSFRSGGGGTGEEIDTDKYDYMEKPYRQLIVWDPQAEEIIGGYRFLPGTEVELNENGQPKFVMAHLFTFSEKFVNEFMPNTIELGRAFVQPDYQTSKMGTKSLFALDNLWDGLGALIHSVKDAKYFIGKVTIYNTYPTIARELIYEYMYLYFPDKEELIRPKIAIEVSKESKKKAKKIFSGKHSSEDYKALQKAVRAEGETIPALFNAYIGLTDTMRMFGSILDHDFGSVYETGIMVTMADLLETKRKRYIEPYIEYLKIVLEERKVAKRLAREAKHKEKEEKAAGKAKKDRQKKTTTKK
ncbi:MAG: GNAT family N-acetyltransferase [Paludibacteraceae bacterium]|nr:GNAT family N-acetyltransferase [Paludibacteraceae bacterium]